jgi:hypothetical protein
MSNSNKLSSNSNFKLEFQCEKYLGIINKDNHRISLTKFRISAHNLEIETMIFQEKIGNVEFVH